MKSSRGKLLIGTLYTIFLGVIIYAANSSSLYPTLLKWVHATPGADKAGHFVLVGTLAFLVNWILSCRTISVAGRRVFLGSVICFVLFTGEEISQIWIPSRTFDFFDFLANTLGILLIGSLAKMVTRANVPAEPAV